MKQAPRPPEGVHSTFDVSVFIYKLQRRWANKHIAFRAFTLENPTEASRAIQDYATVIQSYVEDVIKLNQLKDDRNILVFEGTLI